MIYKCDYCLQEIRPLVPLTNLRCKGCENTMYVKETS